MRSQISRPEHALLTLSVAQKMAGPRKTPSAMTLRQANTDVKGSIVRAGVSVCGGTDAVDRLVNRICGDLSGISGMSGDETGSFWDSTKNAITSAASKVMPFTPFFGPSATLAVPAARALLRASSSRAAPTASADTHDEESVAMVGYERGRVENYDYIFGFRDLDEHVFGDRGRSDAGAWDHDSLVFGADVEDTLIYGEGGGSSERSAANRRQGSSRTGNGPRLGVRVRRSGDPMLRALTRMKGGGGAQMTPEVYRAAIIQRGKKLAISRGRRSPNTKDMFDAQVSVDTDLSRTGARVVVPGAQPGRVTR